MAKAQRDESIHVLRNPYGYAPEQIKTAQLDLCDACDELESRLMIFEATLRHIALEDPTAQWAAEIARGALLTQGYSLNITQHK